MTTKFYDGKEVTTYERVVNVQFLERNPEAFGTVYVITLDGGIRITVYGELIYCEA